MKYAAIITYTNGEYTCVLCEADSRTEAWKKLADTDKLFHARCVDMSEVTEEDY